MLVVVAAAAAALTVLCRLSATVSYPQSNLTAL